ncbi:MAG: sigma-70 family RNA polymerase sigma factor [Clostridia bacterium]|nr:sigma-70 family RNA polymerase sigma factor [Clostridia bacterium]
MDDSKIIDLLFERSEQAIAELTSRYGPACLRIAEGILNNRQDAEECVNDAYLAVWNTVPPQKPDHLPGYVFRIVRNLALKKYHENTALKRNSSYDVALDEITEFLPGSASVEDDVAVKEISEAIDDFLETLDGQSRILFVRRYWYADSVEELARLSGRSGHYISVRLSRIRKALKKYLNGKGVFV